jgi:sulfate transport system ATP-binding protein
MNKARIEQVGTPQQVYDKPATPFVFEFLGAVNRIKSDDGTVRYARPHELAIVSNESPDRHFVAVVHFVQTVGPIVRVTVRRYGDDTDIDIELSRHEADGMTLHRALEIGIVVRGGATFPESQLRTASSR